MAVDVNAFGRTLAVTNKGEVYYHEDGKYKKIKSYMHQGKKYVRIANARTISTATTNIEWTSWCASLSKRKTYKSDRKSSTWMGTQRIAPQQTCGLFLREARSEIRRGSALEVTKSPGRTSTRTRDTPIAMPVSPAQTPGIG